MSSARRRPLIAGNWKMHKTIEEARELAAALAEAALPRDVDVAVCPPFTALAAVGELLRGSRIALGAQNVHEARQGPYTGEISATMLRDLGVTYVIIGHCERRQYFNETDLAVARKVEAALEYGLVPILAVGETAEEHAEGRTIEKVVRQTRLAFDVIEPDDVARCVVAYEPIWAIGTGKVDTPESANAVMQRIRESVEGLEGARVLYGGSMNGDNATALMAQPNIDGGLIGGASLTLSAFLPIVQAASSAAARA